MQNIPTDLSQQTVIVTGASSGIGEATARALVENGAQVMLAARREGRLKELKEELNKIKPNAAAYCVTDVTKKSQVDALFEATQKHFGGVTALVNNAGLMPLSMLEKNHVEEWEQMVDVNIKGVLYGISAAIPAMKAKGGHIVNISSVAGHKVMPGSAVYSGTKFAVRAISEGLRQELGDRIRVTIISPGAVDTELASTITDEDIKQKMSGMQNTAMDSKHIANSIVFALSQPEEVSINEILVRPTQQTGM